MSKFLRLSLAAMAVCALMAPTASFARTTSSEDEKEKSGEMKHNDSDKDSGSDSDSSTHKKRHRRHRHIHKVYTAEYSSHQTSSCGCSGGY